jgi:adenine phosphoribosyltransferase
VIARMEEIYRTEQIDGVIVIESRGFLIGSCFALHKKLPLVLARKKGKLPGKTFEESYALEYGHATLQIQESDLTPRKKWLIVDDLIATGGTIEAVAKMVKSANGIVAGVFSIIGLPFLNYAEKIGQYNPVTLIDFHVETM